MSTMKTALLDAEDALASVGRDEYEPDEIQAAARAAKDARVAISCSYDDLRGGIVAIQHRTLRTVLMRRHGVKPTASKAFNARLKHILGLGLVFDRRGENERRRTYRLVDVLEIALCLQLQRSYVPPGTAVRFIVDNRVHLDKFWSQGEREIIPRLYVEVDAFAVIGIESSEGKRGTRGADVGTISLDRLAHLRADAVPPSSLMIDTADLQRRVHDQLAQVGAIEATTARAGR